jgi:hypothetical protein
VSSTTGNLDLRHSPEAPSPRAQVRSASKTHNIL